MKTGRFESLESISRIVFPTSNIDTWMQYSNLPLHYKFSVPKSSPVDQGSKRKVLRHVNLALLEFLLD